MMTYQPQEIARYRIQEARNQAERRRLARPTDLEVALPSGGVIDAVGHGLIAIGSRLVRDPTDGPGHRRAA